MNSILKSERHQTALQLEKQIIGDPPRGSEFRQHAKQIRAERQIGRFLRYEIDEAELRQRLQAIAADAGASAEAAP
jgi:hypothetical protein